MRSPVAVPVVAVAFGRGLVDLEVEGKMADKDNVESNPILAFCLAAVALVGVFAGLLPPGLLERMAERNTADSMLGAPTVSQQTRTVIEVPPLDHLSPATGVSTEASAESIVGEQASSDPVGSLPEESPGAAAGLPAPPEVLDERAGLEAAESTADTVPEREILPEPVVTTEESPGVELPTEASVYRRAEERFHPPAPAYPAPVTPWAGYPGYGYPPVYKPYYPPPR